MTLEEMLRSPVVAYWLHALRALSEDGEPGAAVLAAHVPKTYRYPWLWALSRCAPAALLKKHPEAQLLARHAGAVRGPSRAECCTALRSATRPLDALKHALALVDLHGHDAILPLIDFIEQRPPAGSLEWPRMADLAAFALGRVGPAILTEVRHSYYQAAPESRPYLALALWYMYWFPIQGGSVRGGSPPPQESDPIDLDDSEMATALLFSFRERGSQRAILGRRSPVWLDEAAVDQLARLAFDVRSRPRAYAATVLQGYGPADRQARRVLEQLRQDPEESVRLAAGGIDPVPDLLAGPTRDLKAALDDPEQRPALLELLRQAGPAARRHAGSLLPCLKDPLSAGAAVAALRASGADGKQVRSALLRLARVGPERLAAAELLLDLGDPGWAWLLWTSPDPEVRQRGRDLVPDPGPDLDPPLFPDVLLALPRPRAARALQGAFPDVPPGLWGELGDLGLEVLASLLPDLRAAELLETLATPAWAAAQPGALELPPLARLVSQLDPLPLNTARALARLEDPTAARRGLQALAQARDREPLWLALDHPQESVALYALAELADSPDFPGRLRLRPWPVNSRVRAGVLLALGELSADELEAALPVAGHHPALQSRLLADWQRVKARPDWESYFRAPEDFVLLDSADPRTRAAVADCLQAVPPGLPEAVAAGHFLNESCLRFLMDRLPASRMQEIVRSAYLRLDSQQRPLFSEVLERLE